MEQTLRAAGALCRPLNWAVAVPDLAEDHDAVASCRVVRCGEMFVEPGRAFSPAVRFRNEVILPADVERTTDAERSAILHLARMLLQRCPSRPTPETLCEGWLRLQVRSLSHLALAGLAAQLSRHFPRLRLEIEFVAAIEIDPGKE